MKLPPLAASSTRLDAPIRTSHQPPPPTNKPDCLPSFPQSFLTGTNHDSFDSKAISLPVDIICKLQVRVYE